MKDHVVCAVEPTEEGNLVWEVAQRVANSTGSRVHVINVVKPMTHYYANLDFAPLVDCPADWQSEVLAQHEAGVKDFVPFGAAEISVVEGYPMQRITELADEVDASLIVMGVHNRQGLRRFVGSTTHSVLNHSTRDVLAVHPDSKNEAYQRVLVAVDTSEVTPTILAKAKHFTDLASHTQLLTVQEPINTYGTMIDPMGGPIDSMMREIRKQTLAKILAFAAHAGYPADVVTITLGDPRAQILEAAQNMSADLIITGSHVRNTLNRLLLGSVAHGVLNQTTCDVLVCRP